MGVGAGGDGNVFASGAGLGMIRPASTGTAAALSGHHTTQQQQQQHRHLSALDQFAVRDVSSAGGDIAFRDNNDTTPDFSANRNDELFLLMMQRQMAAQAQSDSSVEFAHSNQQQGTHGTLGGRGVGMSSMGMGGQGQSVEHPQHQQGSEAVLRRLCDDTYVPTQPWPVAWEVDAFFCCAVVAQLQQFGGTTTISKLRGFLRSRVNASDNIKSVPLKAMLSGYPAFFVVRGNQVALTPSLAPGPGASMTTSLSHHSTLTSSAQFAPHGGGAAAASMGRGFAMNGAGSDTAMTLLQQQQSQSQSQQQHINYGDFLASTYQGPRSQGLTAEDDAPDNDLVFGHLTANLGMDRQIQQQLGLSSTAGNGAGSADQQSSFSFGL